ncbi:hypothetical protein TD95_000823 [Thielaviopsis punctulata]|uniref:Rho-GAP domain-containing protein n=1 Tax=Thielaviopsis punctulata TaxID=72032 RepID=A0A0F4ZKT4_9PEZI|nr:hypothetical protein TD95_000823 [Thielaviopsis punctulata]
MFVEADSSLDLTLGASIGANAPAPNDINAVTPRSNDGENQTEKSPQELIAEKKVKDVLGSEIAITTMLTRLKQNIGAAKEFATFLKKRSLLEDDYAQGVKKLCRSTQDNMRRPDHKQGTFFSAYEEMLSIQDRMADNGMLFAQMLYRMAEELTELATTTERNRKTWKATGLSAEQRVSDFEAAMRKSKHKYDSLAEEYERAKTGDVRQTGKMFGFKASKSAAQQEEDLLKKTQAADTDYKTRVHTLQSEMSELISKSRPEAVSALQDLARESDSGLALQMQKFATYNEKLLLSNGLCVSPLKGESEGDGLHSLREVVARIDNEKDLQDFLVSHHSKMPPAHRIPSYERHPNAVMGPNSFQSQPLPKPGSQQAPSTSHSRNFSMASILGREKNEPPTSSSSSTAPPPMLSQSLASNSTAGAGAGATTGFGSGPNLNMSQSVQPQSPSGPGHVSQLSSSSHQSQTQSQSQSQYSSAPVSSASAGNRASMLLPSLGGPPGNPNSRFGSGPGPGPSPNAGPGANPNSGPVTGPPQLGALSFQGTDASALGQFNSPTSPTAPHLPQIPLSSQLPSSDSAPAPSASHGPTTSNSVITDTLGNRDLSGSPPSSGPSGHGPLEPSSSSPPPPTAPQSTSAYPTYSATQPLAAPSDMPPPTMYNPSGSSMLDVNHKKVFGLSLEQLYERDSLAVPMVIIQCLQAVDLYGLSMEGIYRQSGSMAHISRLKAMFDTDSTVPQLDFRVPENFFHDVNSVTGLLKQFLRDLPDPLMTRANHQALIEAAQIEDDTLRRDTLHAIINGLPDPNYATLRALTLHLHRVMEQSHVTRMNSHNLAVIFGPTLMGSLDPNTSVSDAGWQIRVIDTILQNTYQIFDDD